MGNTGVRNLGLLDLAPSGFLKLCTERAHLLLLLFPSCGGGGGVSDELITMDLEAHDSLLLLLGISRLLRMILGKSDHRYKP